jgi:NAD(P)-dependent dehydrogenase (short-subunit alcohol dehydrogenase family)
MASERGNIHIIVTDIASPKALGEAAAEVGKLNGGKLDILVLNAGSAGPDTANMTPSAL